MIDTVEQGGALPRLALFARLLRDCGLDTTPQRIIDAARVLHCVDVARRDDVRTGLAAVFVTRHEECAVFDAAFDIFFSRQESWRTAGSVPQRSRPLPLDPEVAAGWREVLGLPLSQLGRESDDTTPEESSGYSPAELLRQRDFSEMTSAEERQARRLLLQAPWRVTESPSRRHRPSNQGRIDLRRTLRRAPRVGGEALVLAHSRPRHRRRPLVLIVDVSGSMDRVSRMLLLFAHAVARREHVETFVFSTRLTRVSHLLRRRDVDTALDHTTHQVHDIGGGTRIGESLRRFNRDYARRVLGHGAVVLILSDGWDRGDIELLDVEMARLRRSCRRLVWLNPLLGAASYRPEARGMVAALRHVDDFLAANNLDALDDVGRRLAALSASTPRTDHRR